MTKRTGRNLTRHGIANTSLNHIKNSNGICKHKY